MLRRADQELRAHKLTYRDPTKRADAVDNVHYQESGLAVSGEKGYLYLGSDRGELAPAHYRLTQTHGHGTASDITLENSKISHFHGATYTTCPPGKEDWWLHAGSLTLDQGSEDGVAHNAWMSFFGVPLFYTPYISFPIGSKRRSGFLFPTYRGGGGNGLDIGVPYYWNIAPNYDATFTPRLITKRGLMLGTQFRYLHANDHGAINLDVLPHDRVAQRNRWLASWQHTATPLQDLSVNVDANRVSDDQYLGDFGDNLSAVSVSYLESKITTQYQHPDWGLTGELQTWQTVDPSISPGNEPYRQLPRLEFNYLPISQPLGIQYQLDAQSTYFSHPYPDLKPTGWRFVANPRVSLPIQKLAYFIVPEMNLHLTQYDLHNPAAGSADTPGSAIPSFSLDSGLHFERTLDVAGRTLTQTLEPRLYYLYTPYRNQSNQPLFDTADAAISYDQLFRDNRFTGYDRVGDANQLTLGLTSRFLDQESGWQYLRASLGEIFYFANRRVTLTSPTSEDRQDSSNVVAELVASPSSKISASADYQWNPHDNASRRGALSLSYHPRSDALINAAYSMRADQGPRTLEQTNINFVLPIGNNWHVIGGWNYSLLYHTTLESFGGFEYGNCCWKLRFVDRRYVNPNSLTTGATVANTNHVFMLQLEFIGLGNVGAPVQTFLTSAVSGYPEDR